MGEARTFSLTVEQGEGYRFDITFDDPEWDVIRTDEPRPLGEGSGPNPVRLLGAAVGNCLAASLAFCLEKAQVEVERVRARVTGTVERNDRGRLRVGSLKVTMEPVFDGPVPERFHRCAQIFEDFCIVTESVRSGVQVDVDVQPVGSGDGAELMEPALG
jgi:uncharacterized OsmC-like protein